MERFFYDSPKGRICIDVPEGVYSPQEDSILLAEAVEKEICEGYSGKILDMGCGTGFISVLVSLLTGNSVFAADSNPKAVRTAMENAGMNRCNVKAVWSDLFSAIEGKFDLIIFNAPYLPSDENDSFSPEKSQWCMDSSEGNVVLRFLRDAKSRLENGGKILVLFSSLSGDLEKAAKKLGYSCRIIARKKIDWEELLVYRMDIGDES